jgi:glycosyltransferase involved in cell wall biosynthesis
MKISKKVLIVAFYFPPYSRSSGAQRPAKFVRYLPQHGWTPYVLTANKEIYELEDRKAEDRVPADVHITRALALDAQRHLAFRGRYLGWTALPDRWASWVVTAVLKGVHTIYRHGIDVIVVTFPIASAALIGWALHRITGKPLVMDFRDSMTEENYPSDPKTKRVYRWIERKVIESASRLLFTTRSTREMYLKRYPSLAAKDCIVINNGFDEEDFDGVLPQTAPPDSSRPLRLVHSGVIYTEERDPRPFFRALKRLKTEGTISAATLRVDLRASGSEDYYSQLLQELGIADIVHLLPPVSHRHSLEDSATADGLLLLQAANCNHQIPAKIYEYLKFEKPILALTADEGDTAALLKDTGGATIVDLADEDVIYAALPRFIAATRANTHPLPLKERVARYTRRNGTKQLAACLDEVVVTGASTPSTLEDTQVSQSN